jgi:carotenoid cleavage dioxygenase
LDPRTGEMFAFGFSNDDLFSPDVIYYEIDGRGRVRHEVKFELPYHCMQHDFGLTRDYVIWPIVPLCGGGVERLKQRLPFYGWDPTKPIYLCVLPRGGRVDDIRWFTGPTQFAAHVMNAFNEGTVVHLDVCRSDGNGFPFFPEYGKAFDFDKSLTRLARWTVEYAEGGRSPQTAAAIRSTRQLSDFIGDFPRIDHRFQGSAYRHGWMLKWTGSRNALAHVDLKSGTTDVFETPADTPLQEPCFIPRSPGAVEGDGYIIQVATRTNRNLTEVLLLDATQVSRGPIATLKLPIRLRYGWHGCWAEASELAPSAPRT